MKYYTYCLIIYHISFGSALVILSKQLEAIYLLSTLTPVLANVPAHYTCL